MPDTFFFMFNYKGNTKPYYRLENKIYDHFNQEVESEDLKARIFDNHDINYYRLPDIIDVISSIPIVVNLVYFDDTNFQSTYVLLSTESSSLRVLFLEEIEYPLNDYIPYDIFSLYHFPSSSKLPPFNTFFLAVLRKSNKHTIKELANKFHLEIVLFPLNFDPPLDPKTGLPTYVLIHNLRVTFIDFEEFNQMLQSNKIYRCIIDDDVQRWAKNYNTIITIFGINGITYLLNGQCNKESGIIYPPK